MTTPHPIRSALYVPGINERALDKSSSIDADWIIYDLEDSVAAEQKATARDALFELFGRPSAARSRTAIRCNAVDTEEFTSDLELVSRCSTNAVLLPKVSNTGVIDKFAQSAESTGLNKNVSLWLMIETSKGIAQLDRIIDAASGLPWRLQTLVVGHNDIASETGVSLTDNRRYLIPWLMQIVLLAKSAQIEVVDSVWNNFRDLEGFENEALQATHMGFDGKTLIHPGQVPLANQVFLPGKTDMNRAQRIVDAFSDPENSNANVLNLEGEMVERLHFDQAQRLIAKYRNLI